LYCKKGKDCMNSFYSVFSKMAVLVLIFSLVLFPVPSFAEEGANTPAAGVQEGSDTGAGSEALTDVEAAAGAGEAGTGVAGLSKAAIIGLAVGGAAVVGITAAALSNSGGGGHHTTTGH
jgi:hypothetical protein